MSRYSLDEFVNTTRQKDQGQGIFEMESARLLEVNLNGRIWTKMGSMVAYRGQVKFTREGILEHGVGKFFKKAVSGEGARLTKAEGTGKVYLADQGKKVTILNLQGETIVVNGNDLLAFEEQIQWDISIMKKNDGNGGRRAVQCATRRARISGNHIALRSTYLASYSTRPGDH